MRTATDEEGQHALLKADGKYELDTIARGDLKTPENTNFVARNDRFDFKLDPKSHAEHQGEGTVAFNDKARQNRATYDGKFLICRRRASRELTHTLSGRMERRRMRNSHHTALEVTSLPSRFSAVDQIGTAAQVRYAPPC